MNNKLKIILIVAFVACFAHPFYANVSQVASDSISTLSNANGNCSACSYSDSEHSTVALANVLVIAGLIMLGGIWLYTLKKKTYLLILAVFISCLVIASYFVSPYLLSGNKNINENCPRSQSQNANIKQFSTHCGACGTIEEQSNSDSTRTDTIAFIPVSSTNNNDEFSEVSSDEFSSASSTSDEFTAMDESEIASPEKSEQRSLAGINKTMILEPAIIFLILGMIGFLIKYEWFRKTRIFFLVGSLIYLGFIRGACPCMISSFQNGMLMIFGIKVAWESLLFFLVLIPATYFFGKVWCGWLCHLGAFQEILHRPSKFNFVSGRKAQKVLKIVQISVLVLWILQLLFTRSNIFILYDPFKAAFNLFAVYWISWVFLAVLIVSSLLIHRPFCRTMCPVGLILGWVTALPGARRLEKNDTCANCKSCSKSCDNRALINEEKITTLNQQDCILCGECMSNCKTPNVLQVKRKSIKRNK